MQEGERISNELPKPDSEQMYNSFGVIDNNKCLLEGGEDLATGEQVSKELLKQEVEWMYNSIGVIDNKRPLEDRRTLQQERLQNH